MKILEAIFEEMPNLVVDRPNSKKQSRKTLELDDELFLPIDAQPSKNDHAGSRHLTAFRPSGGKRKTENRSFRAPKQLVREYLTSFTDSQRMEQGLRRFWRSTEFARGDLYGDPFESEQTQAALDIEERHWPVLSAPPQIGVSVLEGKITEQSKELAVRCRQVADLFNLQQQQASELEIACDEIDRLNNTIESLQDTATQQKTESAATKKTLVLAGEENIALREQLDKTLIESAGLSKRLLAAETAFNDRAIAVSVALERVEPLNAELTAALAQILRLSTALDEANQLRRDEINQQKAHFENQIRMISALVAEQDMQIRNLENVRDMQARRCDDLAKTVNFLEGTLQSTRDKCESQIRFVKVLETRLRFERETVALKIKELNLELERERLERSASELASAELRKKIIFLLPKLAARRNHRNASELDTSVTNNNAA